MYTYDEVAEELDTFEHDYPDETERRDVIINYVLQVQEESSGTGHSKKVKKLADEIEFTIKVHEAMACATGEVPVSCLPQGNLEPLILKMAPRVAKWLLEDFIVSEKE